MEIALSILKPELRDKDEMLAELLKHGRGGLKQRQHKLDKLEREMSSLGSGNRKGKGKEDKPRTGELRVECEPVIYLGWGIVARGPY